MTKSTRSTAPGNGAAALAARHPNDNGHAEGPPMCHYCGGVNADLAAEEAAAQARRNLVNLEFIKSSESDPSPSRVVFALRGVTSAMATITQDRDADIDVVNGLAEAAALLADQLADRLDGETAAA